MNAHRSSPGLHRAERRDQDLVAQHRPGAEHLRPAERDALAVLVAHRDGEVRVAALAPGLRAVALRVDDDVGEVEVAVAREGIVVAHGLRPLPAVVLVDVAPHAEPGDGGRDVVGRAPHEPVVGLRPRDERLAARDEVRVAARQQPHAAHAVAGQRRLERHALDVLRRALEVVESGDGPGGAAVRLVPGDGVDACAVEVDAAPVLHVFQVLGSGAGHQGLRWLG